jgi:hypothetical protein
MNFFDRGQVQLCKVVVQSIPDTQIYECLLSWFAPNLNPQELRHAIREATLNQQAVPLIYFDGKAVSAFEQSLFQAMLDYLPSPWDLKSVQVGVVTRHNVAVDGL